jgi:hypothetical protein
MGKGLEEKPGSPFQERACPNCRGALEMAYIVVNPRTVKPAVLKAGMVMMCVITCHLREGPSGLLYGKYYMTPYPPEQEYDGVPQGGAIDPQPQLSPVINNANFWREHP